MGGFSGLLLCMATKLVKFWESISLDAGPLYVHPEDSEWISGNWKGSNPLGQARIPDWDAYLRSERFGLEESQPHFSLIPVPYVGNLERAKIIICLANPGLADADYYAESQPAFKQALEENLKQKPSLDYPFVYLNPEFAWSPAFQWWSKRLKPIIDRLTAEGRSYSAALHELSKAIAVVELFPYHSRDVAKLQGWSGQDLLPSVRAMHEYFDGLVGLQDKVIALMRSHALWTRSKLNTPTANRIHAKGRAISFSAESPVGKAMLSKLLKSD